MDLIASLFTIVFIVLQSPRCQQFKFICLLSYRGFMRPYWHTCSVVLKRMDMYPLLVRCVGVIDEMSGIVGDRFGAVWKMYKFNSDSVSLCWFFRGSDCICLFAPNPTLRHQFNNNWGKYWEAVIVMRCIHTRNCDAQLTEFNSDVYRQGNVWYVPGLGQEMQMEWKN